MSKLLDIKNLSVDFNVRDTKFRAVDSINPVSYTHLTLPTILLV